MEHLYTPWRSGYITQEARSKKPKGENLCFFCQHQKSKEDQKNLVVARYSTCFILLNLYPYNDGHLLIAPYRHIGDPGLLSEKEWQQLHEASRKALQALEKTIHPDGFNLGMNLGRVAGAGVDKHLHLHLVPRWLGDTNFMPITAKTKMINQNLNKLYVKLKPALKAPSLP